MFSIDDSDLMKWEYKEHTRIKHVLLEKYLQPWMQILGSANPIMCYFDGFAGRGKYADGTVGSPIIALKKADDFAKHYRKIFLVFIENNEDNFANLTEVVEQTKQEIVNLNKMTIEVENTDFVSSMDELFRQLEEEGNILVPSFFFIDPFGFGCIPFTIIKRILSNPKTEVFFTFMVRDIARFVGSSQLEKTFTDLFGTDGWKSVMELPDREKALIELYRKQLHEAAGVKYSTHFRVCEDKRSRTLYYLIHANNNFKGHEIMKGIMRRQGSGGSFAYLGPRDFTERHQTKLFDVNNIDELKATMIEKFSGETLSFDDLQEKMCHPWYDEPPFIEKDYRKALKELKNEGKVNLVPVASKTTRGLKGNDRVSFL